MSFNSRGFGRRLAAAREWAGLDPKQVASHLGLTPEAINRWERGGLTRPPGKGHLRLLSEILGQSEAWLLGGNEPPWLAEASSPAPDEVAELAQKASELTEALRQLAAERREPAPRRAEPGSG